MQGQDRQTGYFGHTASSSFVGGSETSAAHSPGPALCEERRLAERRNRSERDQRAVIDSPSSLWRRENVTMWSVLESGVSLV
eukprot:2379603-Rhodomonas_salina.1